MNGQKQNFFRIFLAGVLILLSFAVYAQENTVTGKVYDVSGEPIIGANVVVKGTTNGTITGLDGDFSIPNVKKGDVILILEAMKMENDVVAPEDGTVASINVSAGDAVEAGDVLATLN